MGGNQKDLKPYVNINGLLTTADVQLVLKMIETPSLNPSLSLRCVDDFLACWR